MSTLFRMAVACFFVAVLYSAGAETAAGRWEGSLQIPDRECDLIVDLAQVDGKKDWTGSIIIPGLGVKGVPLTDLAIGDGRISFTIKGALASERTGTATFRGKLDGEGRLTGDFLQAGNSAPFALRKIGPAQVELPLQSTAINPALVGEWKGDYEMDGYPRHVTLILANREAGPARAQLVVIGKRTTDAPIDLVTEENGFLSVSATAIGVSYEGRLDQDGQEIRGTFTVGPNDRPLALRKAP